MMTLYRKNTLEDVIVTFWELVVSEKFGIQMHNLAASLLA